MSDYCSPCAVQPVFWRVRGIRARREAGEAAFRARHRVPHRGISDNGDAQGPSLIRVLGRPAAGAPPVFVYPRRCASRKLTWDAATMTALSQRARRRRAWHFDGGGRHDEDERDNLLPISKSLESAPRRKAMVVPASEKADKLAIGRAGPSDRITAACATYAVLQRNLTQWSSVVPSLAGATLALPSGFSDPSPVRTVLPVRHNCDAPNGNILVMRFGGRVTGSPHAAGVARAAHAVYLKGLRQHSDWPFIRMPQNPARRYVAETHRVTRYRLPGGRCEASRRDSNRRTTSAELRSALTAISHFPRMASSCSSRWVPDRMWTTPCPRKTPSRSKHGEAQHGLGAALAISRNR